MEWLVLLLLGGAFIGTLSSALRSQRRASPHSSVHSFRRSMRVLARNGPRRGPAGRTDGRLVLVLDDPARVAAARAGGDPRGRPARSRAPGPAAGRGPEPRHQSRSAPARHAVPPRSRSAARGPRARMTPAARRRLVVLRGLVGAVVVSVAAWAALGGWAAALLAVSLLALAGYCALLASVRHHRRHMGTARREGTAVDADPVAHSA